MKWRSNSNGSAWEDGNIATFDAWTLLVSVVAAPLCDDRGMIGIKLLTGLGRVVVEMKGDTVWEAELLIQNVVNHKYECWREDDTWVFGPKQCLPSFTDQAQVRVPSSLRGHKTTGRVVMLR